MPITLKASYDKCSTFPFTASQARSAGDVIVSNGRLGIVYEDVESGDEGILITGVPAPGINLKKASGVSFSANDVVTWDVADGNCNADTANNTTIGYAYQDAAGADDTVRVVLLAALNRKVA